jgi:hypothetical protein
MKNNNTKALFAAALILAVASLEFSGCKKGEEDPTISLRSRKARVAGTWMVASMTDESMYESESSSSGTSSSYTTESSMSFDGTNYNYTDKTTQTSTGPDYTYTQVNEITAEDGDYDDSYSYNEVYFGSPYSESYTWSGDYEVDFMMEYTFEKDGTFTATTSRTQTTDISTFQNGETYNQDDAETFTATVTGTWSFIDGNKEDEFKSGERIALWYSSMEQESEIESTYTSGSYQETDTDTDTYSFEGDDTDPDETWEIVMLKNKEMKVTRSYSYTSQNKYENKYTSTWGSGNSSSDSEGVQSGTSEITFTQE